MKTDVYSWRLSRGLKSDIERAARLKKMRVSAVLDEEQQRLHAAAAPFIGSIRGTNPRRAETANALIKKSLRRRYAR
jgi:hypothetical protein